MHIYFPKFKLKTNCKKIITTYLDMWLAEIKLKTKIVMFIAIFITNVTGTVGVHKTTMADDCRQEDSSRL